ncbi:hypothetical protein AVEN_63591-1 [Araneus ventricosus]|uniref:Uncharacterized protein n=1 Tax=Araneus ventricosus TaxID=182803 RepID=A0A4Y2N4L8_ARAVE|nr:hypothetical protein AVEN_231740-1 [Araneus ventricosus]GBN33589.1 hypothetical protein AVEN_63591-1 [Araneus ventricosus]
MLGKTYSFSSPLFSRTESVRKVDPSHSEFLQIRGGCLTPFANTKQNLVFDWSSLGLLSPPQTEREAIEVFILIGEPRSKLDLMAYKTVNFETDFDQEMVKRPQDVSNNEQMWGKMTFSLTGNDIGGKNLYKARPHHKRERRTGIVNQRNLLVGKGIFEYKCF